MSNAEQVPVLEASGLDVLAPSPEVVPKRWLVVIPDQVWDSDRVFYMHSSKRDAVREAKRFSEGWGRQIFVAKVVAVVKPREEAITHE